MQDFDLADKIIISRWDHREKETDLRTGFYSSDPDLASRRSHSVRLCPAFSLCPSFSFPGTHLESHMGLDLLFSFFFLYPLMQPWPHGDSAQ